LKATGNDLSRIRSSNRRIGFSQSRDVFISFSYVKLKPHKCLLSNSAVFVI
jgi:hypothetical protein